MAADNDGKYTSLLISGAYLGFRVGRGPEAGEGLALALRK